MNAWVRGWGQGLVYALSGLKKTQFVRDTGPKRKRKREIGAGRRFGLDIRDRLLMLLAYYRLYITYDLLGHLFGLDPSNVYRNIKYLEPAVKKATPLPTKLRRVSACSSNCF